MKKIHLEINDIINDKFFVETKNLIIAKKIKALLMDEVFIKVEMPVHHCHSFIMNKVETKFK